MPNFMDALRRLTEGIKVNRMVREEHDGRWFWRKERRAAAALILPLANAFFALARAPLRASRSLTAWQTWARESFLALHGEEGFRSFMPSRGSISAEELPGTNLTLFLDGNKLEPAMAAAAGRELRRAHAWRCPSLGAGWSHGDAHAGNFILQEQPLRARIIDFELMHLAHLPQEVRQADDLAAFLLDLVGRIEKEKWLPCSRGFLRGYGETPLLLAVRTLLCTPPRGLFARLWRGVQTSFLPVGEYQRRMQMLWGEDQSGDDIVSDPPDFTGETTEQPRLFSATTHSRTGSPPSRCS